MLPLLIGAAAGWLFAKETTPPCPPPLPCPAPGPVPVSPEFAALVQAALNIPAPTTAQAAKDAQSRLAPFIDSVVTSMNTTGNEQIAAIAIGQSLRAMPDKGWLVIQPVLQGLNGPNQRYPR